MLNTIYSNQTTSVSEFKKNPVKLLEEAGASLAVLSHNQPAFYAVPVEEYERILDVLEDVYLTKIVKERMDETPIPVDIDDLLSL